MRWAPLKRRSLVTRSPIADHARVPAHLDHIPYPDQALEEDEKARDDVLDEALGAEAHSQPEHTSRDGKGADIHAHFLEHHDAHHEGQRVEGEILEEGGEGVDALGARRLVGARGPAQHPFDELAEDAIGGEGQEQGHRDGHEPGQDRDAGAFEVREPTDQLGHAFGESAHALSGLSPAIRTWILSFLTRYQRLRSVIPRILAARACTPCAFWSASRMARRSHSSSASSSDPCTTGAVSPGAAGLEPRCTAGGRCSGRMTPSESTIAPSSTCCSSRMFPGHGYVHRQRRASVESVAGGRQSRVAARSRRCVTS